MYTKRGALSYVTKYASFYMPAVPNRKYRKRVSEPQSKHLSGIHNKSFSRSGMS